MLRIVTIGWWNGQSSILKYFYDYQKQWNKEKIHVSSIFSMSDDGRTTGVLMREFKNEFWVDLPPPGDLRRWLYSMSDNQEREKITDLYETIITLEGNMIDYTLWEIVQSIDSHHFLPVDIRDLRLDIVWEIAWHKFGNILMATLFYNFDFDYQKMLEYLSEYLQVCWEIIPVTFDRAIIQATLSNGQIIQTQDNISNVADYNDSIKKIELMECSQHAKINRKVLDSLYHTDIIIITPWDLFTSILSNFLFKELSQTIKDSWKKVIFMVNGNNKKWETTAFWIIDFINIFYENTWIIPDYIVANSILPKLWKEETKKFKNDISVKWGEYLILDEQNKDIISQKYPDIQYITGDYIDIGSLYKLNKKAFSDMMDCIYSVIKK